MYSSMNRLLKTKHLKYLLDLQGILNSNLKVLHFLTQHHIEEGAKMT